MPTLAARIAQKKFNDPRAHNRVVLLALRSDITEALSQGWSMMSIWQTLYDEHKISCCYDVFRRFVHHHRAASLPQPLTTKTPMIIDAPVQPSFQYNPHPNPQDLL